MADALDQVKRSLGRDAVILHTRTLTTGGFLGMGGKPQVEITAARSIADFPGKSAKRRQSAPPSPPEEHKLNGESNRRGPLSTVPPALTTEYAGIRSEISDLKGMVTDLMRESRRTHAPSLPEPLLDTYLELVERQVSEDTAQQLVRRVRDELGEAGLMDRQRIRARLAGYVEAMLPPAGPIRVNGSGGPMVIALVGPTGVGKTTTVAKLAANFRLREHRKVGLITIDNYRIAAMEQLRTYAQIIDVPLEVVMTPMQIKAALERLSDCDVILIDTAGRSQKDSIRLNELRCFLEQAKPDEVHLVLSSTSSPKLLDEIVERFTPVGLDGVIFTKLDEAIGFGVILSSLQKAGVRLSYMTTGQGVPDDIEPGQASRVAELILNPKAASSFGDGL